jgi:hypothetical protein
VDEQADDGIGQAVALLRRWAWPVRGVLICRDGGQAAKHVQADDNTWACMKESRLVFHMKCCTRQTTVWMGARIL